MAERVHIPGLRGICEVCHTSILIRADGKLRYHGPHPRPCAGGGTESVGLVAPGAKTKGERR